jgi:hypothetical protein
MTRDRYMVYHDKGNIKPYIISIQNHYSMVKGSNEHQHNIELQVNVEQPKDNGIIQQAA